MLFVRLALLTLLSFSALAQQTKSPIDYVNPFIGSDNDGNVFPGATLPFGFVKLGPDVGPKTANSGYYARSPIRGFSHTHVSGTGGGAKYGNILVAPMTGKLNIGDYGSERANEKASPGYYGVDLTDYKVKAELTASHSAGFHKYTFPATDQAHILIDAGSILSSFHQYGEAQYLCGSRITILSSTSSTEVEGYTRVRGGWNYASEYTVYFHAKFDTPCNEFGTIKDQSIFPNVKFMNDNGMRTGAYFSYKTKANQVIQMKVGISFISIQKAKQNVEREITDWNFANTLQAARSKWSDVLNKAIVEGGTESYKTSYYTALYHNFLIPSNKTGENPKWESNEPYYDDYYAIWDTFRSTQPLLTLIAEDRQVDMIRSLISIYEHEGYLPDARSSNETGMTQGGSNTDVVIADAYIKGLKGIDYEKGFQAMLKNAEVPPKNGRREGRGGAIEYNTLGYVPSEIENAGTRTLEYSNCDWAIAQVAKGLGKNDLHDKYKKRASNWKNLWKPVTSHGASGFIFPKKQDGTWEESWDGFNEFKGGTWGDFFYESHSWEYSLYVPQDVKGLIEKSGGRDKFIARLDTFFLNNYYQLANEPGFLSPCLYHWAGRPDKTALLVNQILTQRYKDTSVGLPGNDDSGAMSSWFAFHAMGFYPNAGQDVYLITSPLFNKTTLIMKDGKKFEIIAKNLTAKNIYVQSAKLNGKPLNQAWFTHTAIKNGGTLELVMGEKPHKTWGTTNLPPSISDLK